MRLRLVTLAVLIACAATTRAQQPVAPRPAPASASAPSPTAEAASPTNDEPPTHSALDARLFLEILIGEIQLRGGDPGSAYGLLLDAAKRSKDNALFRRATDVALAASAGENALEAVTAWRAALPDSTEALRYQVQIMIALNRLADAREPMGLLIRRAAPADQPVLIGAVPRVLERARDKLAVATVTEDVLREFAAQPATRAAALAATGRAWLTAGDPQRALSFATRAAQADPASDPPALLALDMLPATPAAEAIVRDRVAREPVSPSVQLLYVRLLATSQRLGDAAAQARDLTVKRPQLAQPWLTLGAVELELRHPEPAQKALLTYVDLVQKGASVAVDGSTPVRPATGGSGSDDDDADDAPATPTAALTQAWLLLAQAAEQQGDYAGAEKWLARVDNPQRALEVQSRRASLLARQGKLNEARELIRRLPEPTADIARGKLFAEADLLRTAKQWQALSELLGNAAAASPDDADLVYEQAMAEEKLNRLDAMETLLRRVIAMKPDNAHAYNALGYSLADRGQRLPEARDFIRKALDLSPGDPFITDSLGWVEYRLGNREEAIRLLRQAYQARPDTEIAAHLGEVLWTAGQRDEALKVWREGRGRDAGNEVLKETLARLRVSL